MERISLEPLSVRGVPVIDVVAAALLPTSASIGLLGLEARIRIVRVKRQHFSHAHGIHQVIAAPNLLIVAASSDDPVTRLRRSADGRLAGRQRAPSIKWVSPNAAAVAHDVGIQPHPHGWRSRGTAETALPSCIVPPSFQLMANRR